MQTQLFALGTDNPSEQPRTRPRPRQPDPGSPAPGGHHAFSKM